MGNPIAIDSLSSPAPFDGCRHSVPIHRLKPADSPRGSGENSEHVRTLAEVEAGLPPILVHRQTMRVIDGMHRLRAALLRGNDTIEVRFFDGSDEAAFRLAVEANVTHGLPLTLAERKVAAERIVVSHAHWADRAIAVATGLSVKTVSGIRRRSSPEHRPSGSRRVGVDGRVRPLNAADGRLRAGRMIQERPEASLREIARLAGISVSTAKDVRDRVRRGDNPVPAGRGEGRSPSTAGNRANVALSPDAGPQKESGRSMEATLAILRNDPTLRFTEGGRTLLRWLLACSVGEDDWAELLDVVPTHTERLVADLARQHAVTWARFAEELDQRSVTPPSMDLPAQRSGGSKPPRPSDAL